MFVDVLTSAASWSHEPLLTYAVPPELESEIENGQLVAVLYGERLVEGIVWRLHEEPPDEQPATRRVPPTRAAAPARMLRIKFPFPIG